MWSMLWTSSNLVSKVLVITMHKIEVSKVYQIIKCHLNSAQYEIEKLSQDSREQFRNRIRR